MGFSSEIMPSYGSRVAGMTRPSAVVNTPGRGPVSQTSSLPATGAAAMRSRQLLATGGYGSNDVTPYLVLLVMAEAFALVGLRRGFRHYHGG